jgi:hypothetical protein
MKYVVFMLFLCCSLVGKAQSYRLKIVDPVICFDYNRNKLIVIEDSTYQIEISLTTKKAIKKPLKWDGQVSFNELRTEFVPLSEKGSPIYFVDRGCGWVLELRNDSIVRIDQSFHHQNQYGGAFFMHDGRPHVFGGYGLFTTKSILTSYDFGQRQWFLATEKRPRVSFVESVFQKGTENVRFLCTNESDFPYKNNSAYTFNLKTKKWAFLGSTLFYDTLNKLYKPLVCGNLIIHKDKLYELDLLKGKLVQYRLNNDMCKRVYMFNGHVLLISPYTLHGKQIAYGLLEVLDSIQFKKEFYEHTGSLYKANDSKSQAAEAWFYLSIITFIVVIIGFFWWLKRRSHDVKLSSNGVSDQVNEILRFWLNKPDYVLELSEINDFVNYDEPSPDTLKKRRETLLKQLSSELALRYGFLEVDIYTTQSHPKDKRMKMLVLNSMLVSKVKKENSSKFT